MWIIVLILIIGVIVAIAKGNSNSTGESTAVSRDEVSELLLKSPHYAENKSLFNYLCAKHQPRSKVEWLLQSLDMGHEIENNGYYVLKSVEEDLPYYVETESEYDKFHNDEEPVSLGSTKGILELCFLYNKFCENGHPMKQKYWMDCLCNRAESGDLIAQGALCSNQATNAFYPESTEKNREKYKDILLQKAESGDAVAQFAVGQYIAPYRTPEQLDWLEKAAAQGLSDACYFLGKTYSFIVISGFLDSYGNAIPPTDEQKNKYYGKDVEMYLKGAEADNGVMAGFCQWKVAGFYEDGEHILTKDLAKAEYWCRRAAAHGVESAERHLEYLQKR